MNFQLNTVLFNSPEEPNNELGGEQAHCDEAQPRVQRVEVGNGFLRQIVVVEYGQEAENDTWNGTGVEEHMGQFNVDGLQAPAQAVHENGWQEEREGIN